jgi:hypothetical protein
MATDLIHQPDTPSQVISERPETIDVVKWNGYAIQAKMLSNTIAVDSDSTSIEAIDSLKTINTFLNEVENARKQNLAPFSEMVSRINDTFRPIKASLEDAADLLKLKILKFQEAKEQKRLEFEQQQIDRYERELANANGAPVAIPTLTLPAENTTAGNIGAVTQRSVWKWEVEDLSLVPREYLKVDEKLLNEKIRSGVRKIPGIRVFQEKTLAVR